jgi:signal transduction histidine kinase
VQDIQNLLQDPATFFLGQVRISTTRTSERSKVGTLHRPDPFIGSASYNERQAPRPVDGEEVMGVFDPVKDFDGVVLGSLYIGRPMSMVNAISKAQEDIQSGIERTRQLYVIALAAVSVIIGVVIASIFSKRITKRIDQLRRGAETISDGNLDYRLRINSGDEIEVLAEQFNAMAAKLHDSYQTLEKKVEERTRELKESQEAMIQQEKMVGIGQLAAGIAHELNTPLGTIIGYAQMLREDLAMQASVNGNLNDVDEIIEQAGRCRDLVKNLLNFSRRSTTEKSQTDINGVVRKILLLVDHDFAMKGVRIQTALDPNLPKATVNENEIAQVILNLANNAVDSMPDGGDLQIHTTHDETADRICIEVHDTGSGISESDRTRVFEPFFTTKDVGKGTGLGLSICYKIVENHMGTMEFDSVIGKGTTFRVFIPVNAEVEVA